MEEANAFARLSYGEGGQTGKHFCNNHLINMDIYEYLKLPNDAKYMSNIDRYFCPVFEPHAIFFKPLFCLQLSPANGFFVMTQKKVILKEGK